MKRPVTHFHPGSTAQDERPSFPQRKGGNGPSEAVIRNILNYSKALNVLNTKSSGIVKLVLN
jgi:hypothetical protein